MEFTPGTVLEGKVTGIMKFGAFVALPEGKSGLVHISEVSNTYVTDVKDFLTEGQQVKVKIISIDSSGRLNLSIKKAEEPERAPARAHAPARPSFAPEKAAPKSDNFEDMHQACMPESESKMASKKGFVEKKGGIPRRMKTKQ